MTQASEQIARQYAAGSVNQKLWRDIIVNVLDYHNGGLDITPEIKAAQNDAAPNGQVVLPRGNYNLSDKVDIFCHFDAKSATISTVGTLDLAASIVPGVFNILYPDKDIWLPTVIKGGVTTPAKQLGAKADKSYVDSQDALKADTTYVDTQLASKANQTDLTSTANTVSLKADKTYVDTQLSSVASGAPKGTYATTAALQTAFPTGNTNIYLVTADGKWYYWNGSAWTAGGTYQSTGIADGSVAIYNLATALAKSNPLNLLDHNTVSTTPGYVVAGGGLSTAPAGWNSSDFIPVVAGSRYYIGEAVSQNAMNCAFYDSSKVYLQNVQSSVRTGESTGSLVVPAGASFMKAPVLMAKLKASWVAKSEQNIFIQPYLLTISDDNSDISTKYDVGNASNILDYNTVSTTPGYISTSGVLSTSPPGFNSSDFIPVTAGARYYFGQDISQTDLTIAFYNVSKGFVSSALTAVGTGDATGSVVVPAGISYLKMPVLMTKLKQTWMAKSEVSIFLQQPVEMTKKTLKDTIKDFNSSILGTVSASSSNQWSGKNWHAYGTSMTSTAQGKYATKLRDLSGMILTNHGIPGGSIFGNIKTEILSAPANAELITLECGPNDWGNDLGVFGDTGSTTFYGNLYQIFEYVLKQTTARFVTITIHGTKNYSTFAANTWVKNSYNQYMIDFTDAIKKMSRQYSVPCIDAAGFSGMGEGRLEYYTVDQIHHNDLGGQVFADYVWSQLIGLPIFKTV